MKYKLSKIMDIIGGGTPKTTKEEYWNGTIPWLSVKDFNNDQRYVYTTEKSITKLGLLNSSTKLLSKDDTIMSARGTVGELAMIPFPMAFNQSCYGLRAKKAVVEPEFLYYLLKYHIGSLKKNTHGSVFDTVTRDTFSGIEVDIPTLGHQKRIAEVLGSLDNKIELNQRINDNLEQQAQAIYQSLFVYFDGISANQLTRSELGPIPVGWMVKSLSEITTSMRTKAKGNDYKVLSAINTGQLQLSEEYFTKQVFSKSISNYIVVEPFDFAYNPARINIGSIGMNTFGFTGCVSPIYVVIRCEPEYHYFLDFFIKSKRFSEEVKTRASGSVRQSLNYTDFGQIKIACPPIDVIERFNREYEVRLKTIEHLKGENKRLSSIRDTLLPKLMSGEIDVSAIQL
ncbi:restriction endonuclease subunit S [Anaerotruncus sp.]|uniref:restriction endonuclease subunit S n=1 Tax=Anaerotruncus TaxID=244127 RepID=UPI002170CA51|nr:restriction endonuclease subunit S [Anaerotruncus sp.]MCI8494009.1 restriction endonuclease subunit S [Anaerotruncus sp.]